MILHEACSSFPALLHFLYRGSASGSLVIVLCSVADNLAIVIYPISKENMLRIMLYRHLFRKWTCFVDLPGSKCYNMLLILLPSLYRKTDKVQILRKMCDMHSLQDDQNVMNRSSKLFPAVGWLLAVSLLAAGLFNIPGYRCKYDTRSRRLQTRRW